jgi:hypothetical protein
MKLGPDKGTNGGKELRTSEGTHVGTYRERYEGAD